MNPQRSALIAAWSRHGATQEIANRIGATIRAAGFRVVSRDSQSPGNCDVVILGSSIYGGQWIDEALKYVRTERIALSSCDVWLFSSGLGSPTNTISTIGRRRVTNVLPAARDHAFFSGRLFRPELDRKERAVVDLLGIANQDKRDWVQIDAWASRIAA